MFRYPSLLQSGVNVLILKYFRGNFFGKINHYFGLKENHQILAEIAANSDRTFPPYLLLDFLFTPLEAFIYFCKSGMAFFFLYSEKSNKFPLCDQCEL
jgi:hypothetical protein